MKAPLEEISLKVYLINLQDSPQRLHKMSSLLQQAELPFTRLHAIDGASLLDADLQYHVDTSFYKKFYRGKFPGQGTVGCYLSHCKAWQQVVQHNDSVALILEDDVFFNPQEFKNGLKKALSVSQNWDICSFALRNSGCPIKLKALKKNQFLCLYLQEVYCAGAYLINQAAAQALLRHAHPMRMQVDDYYTQTWRWGLRFTGIEPRLAWHEDDGTSEIKKRGGRQNYLRKVLWPIKVFYVLRSGLMRYFYNIVRLGYNLWQKTKISLFNRP